MGYKVTFFYIEADGKETPAAEPFDLRDSLDAYKRDVPETIANMRRPDGPRPDGLRIENEEGEIVFRYLSQDGIE